MFERFTERARQVVVLAQQEARDLKHHEINTGHLLLGLLREEGGLAARTLRECQVGVEEARAKLVEFYPLGEEVRDGQIPFTPGGKKVVEGSLREALSLGHNYIGTEHLLLALVRDLSESDSVDTTVAMRIVSAFDLDESKIRNEVIRLLRGRDLRSTREAQLRASRQPAEQEQPKAPLATHQALADVVSLLVSQVQMLASTVVMLQKTIAAPGERREADSHTYSLATEIDTSRAALSAREATPDIRPDASAS